MTVTISKPKFNLREELTALRRKVGVFGNQVLRSETVDDYYSIVGTNRNLLINGDFRFWQRGTTQTTAGYGSADRWQKVGDANNFTISQETSDLPPNLGFTYGMRLVNNSSGTLIMRQVVENGRAMFGSNTNASTIQIPRTLSVWVKVISGIFEIDIGDRNDTEAFKKGQWHRITCTIYNDEGSAYGVNTYIDMGLNGVGEVIITGAQYELGTVATPFEYRPYQQELALCQRYYYKMLSGSGGSYTFYYSGYTSGAYAATYFLHFPVTMRATPTVASVGSWADGGVSSVTFRASPNFVNVDIETSGAGRYYRYNTTTGDGYTFDAEL